MSCKCVECGGRIDCDSIICTTCLAEIIEKVNSKNRPAENTESPNRKIEVSNR
ncbi:MAG: hypothetical protein JXA01_02965 [Dehalococcoidia bacterium]|nr:hypothetical protein [Dehalococcoidia bacterium]